MRISEECHNTSKSVLQDAQERSGRHDLTRGKRSIKRLSRSKGLSPINFIIKVQIFH